MNQISTITLENTLPSVFLNEKIPPSEIWRRDVTFRKGEVYVIEAASGTGKSSLCAYIFGSRRDFDGRILFDGTDISTFSKDQWQQLRRTALAYLPQELALFPELTALQNIRLKNSLTDFVSEREISQWLEALGIDSRADYPVGKMSIGQQQRVAIIRAICQPFSFLLLDEPVSHLDEANNRSAAQIITEVAAAQGASIIATSVGNRILIDENLTLRL